MKMKSIFMTNGRKILPESLIDCVSHFIALLFKFRLSKISPFPKISSVLTFQRWIEMSYLLLITSLVAAAESTASFAVCFTKFPTLITHAAISYLLSSFIHDFIGYRYLYV